ncbi:16S rRNA processing protein RimM [Helicobacter jaachi]|uniref:Ribosome maturation factor RimM n=1 Tax=Helicobacter jaachi TaxID=1677920 RepID=A0A4U8TAB1_9HELI|nr:ribosome maturation factor RimM [Helicobacter jaachi]TLD96781.1 16S rRNA processing protein RimM [Helicobacter jaachi]
MKQSPLLLVAKVGRLVGVGGALKLHIMSDFPSIFTPHAVFHTKTSLGDLRVHTFNEQRGLITFCGFQSRESAARLVNCELYATLEESRAICTEGEFLWQDIIGTKVFDKQTHNEQECSGQVALLELGEVKDIERIGEIDYLLVATDSKLRAQGLPKQFFVPYIAHFVSSLSPQGIFTHNALSLLEQS